MPLDIAANVIDQIFMYSDENEEIDIGFFGGEPLLQFLLLTEIVNLIEHHPLFDHRQVYLDVVTNGTIFNNDIAIFLLNHNITFCVSCDGPPRVHDVFRKFRNGRGSSSIVEETIIQALDLLPNVLVNAVFHPETFKYLNDVVSYFSGLGLRQIYLSPDYSAKWSHRDSIDLREKFISLAKMYVDFYLQDDPHFINVIDSKIILLLKGGYLDSERCKMGRKEFAFAPSGNIYPCERLIGDDDGNHHFIGHISDGIAKVKPCGHHPQVSINQPCLKCSLKNYCMNWCGCSNFFSTGNYNHCGPLICASEKAAITAAIYALETLEKKMGTAYIQMLLDFVSARICTEGVTKNSLNRQSAPSRRLTPIRNTSHGV